jgi:hypothetical protein
MANTKVTGDLIASSTIATGNIADNAVTSDKISGITTAHITEGSNLYYTNARADARITAATTSDLTEGTNLYYTDARADARAALLVDSAPSTLDTLNELAAALGDDPNFATTVTNSIATKLPLAGGTLTGNLGIGGAASDGNLHVRKTGVNTGITNVLMNANFADGSNGTGLSIGYRTDETTAVLAARTATGNIAFYSFDGGWSESMRITNTGNVGIGVTDPDYTLHLLKSSGDTEMYINGQNGQSSLRMGLDARNWQIKTAAAPYLWSLNYVGTDVPLSNIITANVGGNVGIGTDSPDTLLHVYNPDSNWGAYSVITLGTDVEGTNQAQLKYYRGANTTTESFQLSVRGTTALTALYNGNVGIGTTSPNGVKFQTVQTTSGEWTGDFKNYTAAGYGLRVDMSNSSSVQSALQVYTGAGTGFVVKNTGKVGIGTTSPDEKLDITGGFLKFNGGDYGIKGSNSLTYYAVSDHYFQTNSGTKVVIKGAGNVGIGTTDPDHKLEVVGGLALRDSNSRLYFGTNNGTDRRALEGNVDGTLLQIGEGYTTSRIHGVAQVMGATLAVGDGTAFNTYQGISAYGSNPSLALRAGSSSSWCWTEYRTNGNTNNFSMGVNQSVPYWGVKNGAGLDNPVLRVKNVGGVTQTSKHENGLYSDANQPPAVYLGKSGNVMGTGGIYRLGAVISSSTTTATNIPVVTTYSSGHWGAQPTFTLEFVVTFYRASYAKYWCQHAVSQAFVSAMHGPFGGQMISSPLTTTVTQLCSSCNGGQPVYKTVWKWTNSGAYIRTSPTISIQYGAGSTRVYTDGTSTESLIDTLHGGSGSPGAGILLHGIDDAQAAGGDIVTYN